MGKLIIKFGNIEIQVGSNCIFLAIIAIDFVL